MGQQQHNFPAHGEQETRAPCETAAGNVDMNVATMHRKPGDPAPADPHEECFLAFGRVFSGVLRQVCADCAAGCESVYAKSLLSAEREPGQG